MNVAFSNIIIIKQKRKKKKANNIETQLIHSEVFSKNIMGSNPPPSPNYQILKEMFVK